MARARVWLLLALLCMPLGAPAGNTPSLYARASVDDLPFPRPREFSPHSPLRLGVLRRDNPPYDILGSGQAYEGISADYAGLLAERLQRDMAVQVFVSLESAAQALREGAIDLLASVTEQQAQQAGLRLSRAYAQDPPLLMASAPQDNPRITAQRPFTLVMVEGYRPLDEIRAHYPNARVRLHPSPFSALAALALGQAEVYLGNAVSTRYVHARNPLGSIEEIGPAPLPAQGIGFALPDQDSPLAALIDAALASIEPAQHVRIAERWRPLTGQAASPEPLRLTAAERRWVQHNPRVTVLMDEQLVPLSFRDGALQWHGLSVDILQLISRRSGLQFDIEASNSLQEMVARLGKGSARLIAGVPRSPVLEGQLVFSRAYLSASRVLVTREESQAPTSFEQLAGRRIALVWGSAAHEVVREQYPQVRAQMVSSPLAALGAVARGQATAAVLTVDDARSLIARWYPGRLRINASLPMAPAHFALASAPGQVELQGIINKALLSLAPRESEVLVRRWRNPLIVADSLWPRYRSRVLIGFVAVLALLTLALLWIRSLRLMHVRLRRATRDADSANRAKTQFLTTMSHEIRTPLHAMLGMLELAQLKADQGVFDHLAVEVAAEAARGLLELIGDILDISRIEAGRLHLSPQRVCLREHVTRVVQLFEQQARNKGLDLRLRTAGAVDTEVMLDPVRFKQVVANLLSNAIKFTARGWVEVVLCAVVEDDHLTVDLQVSDSGVGIDPGELGSLGQPFRQASNQQQSPRCSAGLGLGISRNLCEMMGGGLSLHSVPGQGTQVSIRLSLALVPDHSVARGPCAGPTPSKSTALRVLVVDDYPANRLLLAQQLDFLGHTVRVAEDGAQALRLWLKEPFEVVISDCNMPRLNGYALARAMREHERRRQIPACRLIGITANAQPRERVRCRAAGMDECLFKPLALNSLVQALASAQPDVEPAPQPPETQTLLLDVERLQRLVGDDRVALHALLEDLRRSNRDDLTRLYELEHDREALAELAHRIKGGARIAGGEGLALLCEALERCCTDQTLGPGHLQEARQALALAMRRLEHSLEQQAVPGAESTRAPRA